MSEAEAPKRRPRTRSGASTDVRTVIDRLRPRIGTLLALALAGTAVGLAWADPFAKPEDGVLLVNSRTGARRVFPSLVDADPSKATIELQAPDGPVVRIVPTADGGHDLMHGDNLLGPVADEDFDGLWSSLRLATAQRSATKAHGVGQAGVIRISLPDESLMLSLGESVPGSGVYGVFEADGDGWVVESEMLTLVQQPPMSWLSKRLLPVDVELVSGLAWGDELVLARGDDDVWRVRSGGEPALLSSEAVSFRLRRLLRAQLDPFIEREAVLAESLRPWLVVTTVDGGARALHVGGACPGAPDKRLVDRGPGLLGCVPADLFERWPLFDPEAGMIEPRLVPYDYGRIVGIDLEQPAGRKLLRRGGEWFFAGGDAVESVAEEEVRRWYQGVAALEVALLEAPTLASDGGDPEQAGQIPGQVPSGTPNGAPNGSSNEAPDWLADWAPDWGLVVHADSGEQLTLRCMLSKTPVLCVRDQGLMLRVLGEVPRNLTFDAETFAARRLIEIGPGEVRQLEILPPPESASTTVRQSVHADLGNWELDAPLHPDDSGAVDTVRVENLLWALRGLRAEAWAETPSTAPLRHLVAEVVPAEGRRRTVSLDLYPDCVVVVDEQRPAIIGKPQCLALGEDLLFDDPLRFWLERSRGVEISKPGGQGDPVFLRRRDDQFVTNDGAALDDAALLEQLQAWIDWRSAGLRSGEPAGAAEWSLDIRRDFGPSARVEIGPNWVRLSGADWYYLQREPSAGDEAERGAAPVEPAFDADAVNLD